MQHDERARRRSAAALAILTLLSLLVSLAAGWASSARAAGCGPPCYGSGVVHSVPADGAIPVVVRCRPESVSYDHDEVTVVVARTGAEIAVQREVIGEGTAWQLLILHPEQPLSPEPHRIVGPVSGTTELDVGGDAASPDIADIALHAEQLVLPVGQRTCCPSHGEGDCEPLCVGDAGERPALGVGLEQSLNDAGVAWRITPVAEGEEGSTGWRAWDGGGDPFSPPQAIFLETAEEHCVELELWNLVDDSRQLETRCFPGEPDVALGEARERWSTLEGSYCQAPPDPDAWGIDVGGEPDPNDYPAVDERLRQAFCAARVDCLEPGALACDHYAHYCPERAGASQGGAGRAPAGGCAAAAPHRGQHAAGWLLALAAVAALWRRREL